MHKRLRLEMSASYVANEYVDVTAKIDGTGGEPLSKDAQRPEITLSFPHNTHAMAGSLHPGAHHYGG